ncbi:MAG: lysylphosphatidylglycerol synthase domain-containing protein [Pirellulaceae bacterium]
MKQRIVAWLKIAVALVVIAGIARTLHQAYQELQQQRAAQAEQLGELQAELASLEAGESDQKKREQLQSQIASIEGQRLRWDRIDLRWLALSILLAWLGLLPAGMFWLETLRKFGHTLESRPVLAGYFLGHLGKYVPGKAMVFLLRIPPIRARGVSIATGVVSIFVETLVWMGVGAAWGSLSLMRTPVPDWMVWGSIACGLGALLPTLPPIFRQIVAILSRSRVGGLPDEVSRGLDWSLMLWGWSILSLGWILLAASLATLLLALQGPSQNLSISSPSLWAASMAAISLSMVAGFLSLLPGGAGVRELVVSLILQPLVGPVAALLAALSIRLVSLLAELLWIGLFRLLPTEPPSQSPETPF